MTTLSTTQKEVSLTQTRREVGLTTTQRVVSLNTQSTPTTLSVVSRPVSITASLRPVVLSIVQRPVAITISGGRGPKGDTGDQGPAGEGAIITFESVSKNLKAYPFVVSYDGGEISSIVYDLGGGLEITKSFHKTGDLLTTIILSGDIPEGIDTIKTLLYDVGDNYIGAVYS